MHLHSSFRQAAGRLEEHFSVFLHFVFLHPVHLQVSIFSAAPAGVKCSEGTGEQTKLSEVESLEGEELTLLSPATSNVIKVITSKQ